MAVRRWAGSHQFPPAPLIDWIVMTNPSPGSRTNAPEPALQEDLRDRLDPAAQKAYEPDDGPLSPAQIAALQAAADEDLPKGAVIHRSCLFR
jgi:hypothetical protein